MAVSVTDRGLALEGRALPIYSGTVHYWHHDPASWPLLLQRVRELGFSMIETYIPWDVHELAPGRLDVGQQNPRTDLPRFLRLCHDLRLSVCVRPGPHVNAELTWFGFPLRLLEDPAVWARTATGAPAVTDRPPQPFAIPSYASEALFRETAQFFDALCPVLLPFLAPHGPIIACQVDNETCYFFRDRAYDLDYSPDSLVLYRRMLRERYGDIAALNAAYGRDYSDFAAVEPPRDWEAERRQDVPRHLDWVAYREYQITTALNRLGAMLRERGITVPLYHDIAWQSATPIDTAAMEAQPHLDFVGTNLYANQEEYRSLARRVRYQAGSQRLPFVPEFGAGVWWTHHRAFTPAEQEFVTLAALMHGLKAINFYMLVERERWVGSPIRADGTLRPEFASFFRRLSALIHATDLLSSEKRRHVLVLQNYELGRFAAACGTLHHAYLGLAGVPPGLATVADNLDFAGDPAELGHPTMRSRWLGAAMAALEAAQVEYDISDTHLPLERLSRYAMVIAPMAEFSDVEDQHRLLAYAAAGGRLVIGPCAPTLDRLMRPADLFGPHLGPGGEGAIGSGAIALLADPSGLGRLLDPAFANPIRHSNPELRLTIREGVTTLCFLANPTSAPQRTRLRSPHPLWGRWNAEGELAHDAELTLAPYTVQVWEVLR